MPPLPCETRWSSSVKTLEWFIKNWQLHRTVVSSTPDYFSKQPAKEVQKILNDLVVYPHSEKALKSLKPVHLALNKVQGDHVTVGDSVSAWKALLAEFCPFGSKAREWIELAEKRYFNTLGPALFTTYAIHPRYFGWNLSAYWVEKETHCVIRIT